MTASGHVYDRQLIANVQEGHRSKAVIHAAREVPNPAVWHTSRMCRRTTMLAAQQQQFMQAFRK